MSRSRTWGRELPPNQHYIEIAIPAGVTYEVASADHLPGWHRPDGTSARLFGHRWYSERRSAVLFVPSVVARVERNIIINATHDDFPTNKAGSRNADPVGRAVVWVKRARRHRSFGQPDNPYDDVAFKTSLIALISSLTSRSVGAMPE